MRALKFLAALVIGLMLASVAKPAWALCYVAGAGDIQYYDGRGDACVTLATGSSVTINNPPTAPVPVSGNGVPSQVASAAVVAAGTIYAPADTITLTGGSFTTAAVLTVTDTKLVSATVNNAGSTCSGSSGTLTGTTGTGTKFQIAATYSGGVVSGLGAISVAGDYTVNPTSLAAEPVTGNSCTGVTLGVVMGALKASVTTAGSYIVAPLNPVSQSASSGSGTGATWNLSYTTAANVIGGVALGPVTTAPSAQIALTSVTTAYTAGWVIANSATAASVTIPYFAVNVANSTVGIPYGRLVSDDPLSTAWATQTVQVDLWNTAPVYATAHADRATFSLTSGAQTHEATFTCLFGAIQTDGAVSAECTPNSGATYFPTADASAHLYVTMIASTGSGVVTASKHLTFIPKVIN